MTDPAIIDKRNAALPRLLLRIEEAAEMLAISRTSVYGLIYSGQIHPVHVGVDLRSVRIPLGELEAYVDRRRREEEKQR